MAVGLTGGGAVAKEELVETVDESTVEAEAKCEAFTTLEDGRNGEADWREARRRASAVQ